MTDALTISRQEPEDGGPGYVELRARGIGLLQQLAGDAWTDYNEHDPGVTILEQLCYAITELSYRAALPMEDLLAREGGVIDARRQALFPPGQAYPGNPLTIDDQRRLLVDRVPALGNVWISPVREGSVNGLYDILLHVPGADWSGGGARGQSAIVDEVLRVCSRYRNLCEDVRTVTVLSPVRAVLGAVVSVDGDRDPESVVADILFQVGFLLAPEIRREPLGAALARGRALADILEGPRLQDGLIEDAELQPRATRIRMADVTRAAARPSGVLGVREVTLIAGDERGALGHDALWVPPTGILVLDTRASEIRILRRGAVCEIDRRRVQRELDRRWAEVRRRHPLGPAIDQGFGMPRGRPRDLARYTSIQRQLPVVYGINADGPPEGATPARIAETRQLKGYLIVFEQLLADFFAQLDHVKDLYSTDRALGPTYHHQSLLDSVPDAERLLDADHLARLEAALAPADPALERRSRFLDVLLALHADGVSAHQLSGGRSREPSPASLCEAKIALLDHLLVISGDRGRGVDKLAAPSEVAPTAAEIRSRIELGLPASGGGRPGLRELGIVVVDRGRRSRYLIWRCRGPHRPTRSLVLVDHILLRFGERRRSREPALPLSFTVTAVIRRSRRPGDHEAFARSAREVLRRNLPAHIALQICLLGSREMRRFERLHRRFREALACRGERERAEVSARLRRALERWRAAP